MRRALLAALLALLGAPPAAAHPSRGIAVDRGGTVYFSDLIRVWRLDGTRLRLVRRNPGTHTHSMAIDGAGRLVWEESSYDPGRGTYTETVWELAGDRARRRFGPMRPPPRGLGIVADRQGCTFHAGQIGQKGPVVAHRWCPGRRPARLFGSEADDRRFRRDLVQDVAGVALAPDGRFVFRQGGAVRAVDSGGRVQVLARNIAKENFGIALEPAGGLLVAEHGNRRVLRIAGGRTLVATTTPPGWAPTGVAAGRDAFYVLEASDYRQGQPTRMRVRRIARDGSRRVLAQVVVP